MKPFARFNTPHNHEKLVQGIIKERQIRARIEQLSFYIKIGLTNYEEVEKYKEAERKKQELFQKKQKKIVHKFIYDDKGISKRNSLHRRRKMNLELNDFTKVLFLSVSN